MPFRPRRPVLRTLGAALAAALLPLAAVAAPAAAAPAPTPPSFFGVHDPAAGATSWPATKVGSLRIWDSGVTWRQIKPTRSGPWQVARLDQIVKASVDRRVDPVMVLGSTPAWATSRPSPGRGQLPALYGPGSADPPRVADWEAYVTFMVNRYKGRGITHWQIWNEPNVSGFWNGSQRQMKDLSDRASRIIRRADPTAKIIAPSFVLRLPDAQRWFAAYAATGALRSVDAVALQLYPLANQGPEQTLGLLAYARRVLAANRVSKPIWDTEVNYGLAGGRQPRGTYSNALSAAYVSRTLLLQRSAGISRLFWYTWTNSSIVGVQMTPPASSRLTPAGTAFATTRRWMEGQVLSGCTRDVRGTYRCLIRTRTTNGWVFWNPGSYRPVITAPVGTYQVEYVDGVTRPTAAKTKVRMGQAPILIRARR